MTYLLAIVLFPVAVFVALPALADALALLKGLFGRPADLPRQVVGTQRILFIVPAHDEGLLIQRCVASLLAQDYARSSFSVVVIADNCTDDTATQARLAGADTLERKDPARRGKHHAIAWSLRHLPVTDYDAIVIIDADAMVNPGFASALNKHGELKNQVLHTYDGMTNEFENWLTRLAGLLTRNRYDIALPVKRRAGLSCPLTGDGMVLGVGVLAEHGWRIQTITEGWELYARLTVAGKIIGFEPKAVFFDQEARSLGQSAAQRERWAAGRLDVLRLYLWPIVASQNIDWLQKCDLLAELSSFGPVLRSVVAFLGICATLFIRPAWSNAILGLLTLALLHTVIYTVVSLARHPEPGRTLAAFLRLPQYAAWRVLLGLRSLGRRSGKGWIRTARHTEQ